MDYVVLYSKEQDAWHIDTLRDYEMKPKNGYFVEAIYSSYRKCLDYIDKNSKLK